MYLPLISVPFDVASYDDSCDASMSQYGNQPYLWSALHLLVDLLPSLHAYVPVHTYGVLTVAM